MIAKTVLFSRYNLLKTLQGSVWFSNLVSSAVDQRFKDEILSLPQVQLRSAHDRQ